MCPRLVPVESTTLTVTNSGPLRWAKRFKNLRRRHRQLLHPPADRIRDRDGCHRRADTNLADTLHAVGMIPIRHLDHDRIDHRDIESHRHPVVEETRIAHPAVLVVDILLIQRPADPLHHPSLHLALDVARMDRPAGILGAHETQDGDPADLGVDLHVAELSQEPGRLPARVHGASRPDESAGGAELRGDFLQRQLIEVPHVVAPGSIGDTTGRSGLLVWYWHDPFSLCNRHQEAMGGMSIDWSPTENRRDNLPICVAGGVSVWKQVGP